MSVKDDDLLTGENEQVELFSLRNYFERGNLIRRDKL